MKNGQRILLLIGIFFNMFIWYQSSLPGHVSGEKSDTVADVVDGALDIINIDTSKINLGKIVRKLAHFTEFFLFGLVWALFYLTFKPAKIALPIALFQGVLTAVIDETIQYFVPGRAMQIKDMIIDSTGVITAILICLIIILIRNKMEKKKVGYND